MQVPIGDQSTILTVKHQTFQPFFLSLVSNPFIAIHDLIIKTINCNRQEDTIHLAMFIPLVKITLITVKRLWCRTMAMDS